MAVIGNGAVRLLAALALVFAALFFAGVLVQPPAVAVGADGFDTNAARARLVRILGVESPHPTDSDAQDGVRERLLEEINALGFTPEVRDTFACRAQHRGPSIDCMRVKNIVFSLGPTDGPAVLGMAHYDGVPAGPSASDDGAGVAAWLEIARLLKDQPLQRRLLILFTDGEEPGLMGAHVFARDDPLFVSVEAVVNLEARGTRGPAVFFESNRPNADAVNAFAHVARPLASSIMADAYALMPNDTDVTMLRRPDLDMINIALLDGVENYHTPRDSLAALDPRSLQHLAKLGLQATTALAMRADAGASGNLTYSDVASLIFISAPEWLAQGLLGICALGALVMFGLGGKDGRWRALGAPLLAVVLAGGIAFGIGYVLSLVRPGEAYWHAHPEPTRAWCMLVGFLGVALALLMFGKGGRRDVVEPAAFAWFALLGFAGSLALPGLGILFMPAVVIYALGAIAGRFWAPARLIGAVAAALFTLLQWGPTLYLVELALGYDYGFAVSALVAIMLLPWLGVFTALKQEATWRVPALAAVAGAAAAAVFASMQPEATPQKPRPLNILYFQNGTDEARFVAGSALRPLPPSLAEAAAFESVLLFPGDINPTWSAPAPNANAPTAYLGVLSQETTAEGRVIRARLMPNGAYRTIVRIPRSVRPISVAMLGAEARYENAEVSEDDEYVSFSCWGRSCNGAEVTFVVGEAAPAEWLVIGQFPGAVAHTHQVRAARPPWAVPIQNGDGALTLTRREM